MDYTKITLTCPVGWEQIAIDGANGAIERHKTDLASKEIGTTVEQKVEEFKEEKAQAETLLEKEAVDAVVSVKTEEVIEG